MYGATRRVRHAPGDGPITGWRDVRPTGTRIVATQESVCEIEEPMRVGVGVIIYEGYDLTVCSLCASVARAAQTPVLGPNHPHAALTGYAGCVVGRAVVHH